MFKSKFANALSVDDGRRARHRVGCNKLSVGYGAEAGHMDPSRAEIVQALLQGHARRHAQRGVARACSGSSASRPRWAPTRRGRSSPHPPEYGEAQLQDGWDGRASRSSSLCPINPFWWPVKADVGEGAWCARFGATRTSHYRSIYFHAPGAKVEEAYERYLHAFANAVRASGAATKVRVPGPRRHGAARRARLRADRGAARRRARLQLERPRHVRAREHREPREPHDAPRRYHAIVTSMPGARRRRPASRWTSASAT